MNQHEVIQFIDTALEFHKKASVTLGNFKKQLVKGDGKSVIRSWDHYTKLSNEFTERMKSYEKE